MVRLAIRMTSSGRFSYRRIAHWQVSRLKKPPYPRQWTNAAFPALSSYRLTPVAKPAAATLVRNRRREMRSASSIIPWVDIP